MNDKSKTTPPVSSRFSKLVEAVFSPPTTEEADRKRTIRNLLWVVLGLGCLVYALDIIFLPELAFRWWAGLVGIAVTIIPLLILVERGYLKTAAIGFVTLLWTFVSVMVATGGGVFAMLTNGYLILIFMAGLLGGVRYGVTVAVSSVLFEFVLVLYNDKIPVLPGRSAFSQWFLHAFYATTVLVLQAYFVRSIRRAFESKALTLSVKEKIQEDLLESEIRFQTILDNAGAGIALIDRSGLLFLANPALSHVTGYSNQELLSMRLSDLIYSEERPSLAELGQLIRRSKQQSYVFERRFVHKNGSIGWARIRLSAISFHSEKIGYGICIIEDITERKLSEIELSSYREELEERVTERTEELYMALQTAESATRSRNEFLANVSHELRTPMNAILGLLHLALGTELNARQRDYLTKVRQAARDLLVLLNDLLDFSKLESGRFDLESIPFSLQDLMKRVVDLMAVRATEKGLTIITSVDTNLPEFVLGDPMRLRQILMNLIGNAIKFTESGTVKVDIKRTLAPEIRVEFSVTDTGPGIPYSLRPFLFDPFRQADGSMTRKQGGTGLGLTICKQLVDQMGGYIALDESYTPGSRFYFELPFLPSESHAIIVELADANPDENPLGAGVFTTADPYGLQKPAVPISGLVLLVEDNELSRQVAVEFLESFGLVVDVVRNGAEAVAKAGKRDYQLILMDLQMPEVDGFEATRMIREMGLDLPIIAMTAHASETDREKCLMAGMNDHISKPIDADRLYRTLSHWLILPTRRRRADVVHERFDISGFNTESAIERLDYDSELYRRLLHCFVRDHRDDGLMIAEAVRKGDSKKARFLIHALRGAAGNLGAVDIVAHLKAMSELLQANPIDQSKIQPLAGRLETALAVSIRDIESTTRPDDFDNLLARIDLHETGNLQAFELLLARHSLSARSYFPNVVSLLNHLEDGLAAKISHSMDKLEFDEARLLLSSHLERNQQ